MAGGLSLASAPSLAAEPLRVTFVGNSFTLQHDVPFLVHEIARQGGTEIVTAAVARNGARLSEHIPDRSAAHELWEGYAGPQLIVLQPHSTTALIEKHWVRYIGLRLRLEYAPPLVLFEPWPRERGHSLYSRPGMPKNPREMAAKLGRLHEVFRNVAWRRDRIAPVAQAWLLAEGLSLHASDGYHANISGAWLTALVLTRAMGLAPERPVAPEGVQHTGRLAQIAKLVVP